MPAISMFYGIVIAMFFFDDEQHHTPHVHTRYQGMDASVSIVDGTLLAGSIPANKLKLVQAWLKFIEKSSWPTGIWRPADRSFSKLTR